VQPLHKQAQLAAGDWVSAFKTHLVEFAIALSSGRLLKVVISEMYASICSSNNPQHSANSIEPRPHGCQHAGITCIGSQTHVVCEIHTANWVLPLPAWLHAI
jgi:hypothetical protein